MLDYNEELYNANKSSPSRQFYMNPKTDKKLNASLQCQDSEICYRPYAYSSYIGNFVRHE